jgi:hypothetical protein
MMVEKLISLIDKRSKNISLSAITVNFFRINYENFFDGLPRRTASPVQDESNI